MWKSCSIVVWDESVCWLLIVVREGDVVVCSISLMNSCDDFLNSLGLSVDVYVMRFVYDVELYIGLWSVFGSKLFLEIYELVVIWVILINNIFVLVGIVVYIYNILCFCGMVVLNELIVFSDICGVKGFIEVVVDKVLLIDR